MRLSKIFERLTTTLIGEIARSAPAINPARGPKARRTRMKRTTTDTVPAMACGRIRLKLLKPKALTLSVCIHRPSGGLSTLTKPPGSNETKNQLLQLVVMLFTAVA